MNEMSPKIAIIDPNTLAALGLRQLLQSAIPFIEVESFGNMEEVLSSKEQYMHYFVVVDVFLENKSFFYTNVRKTIVLTNSDNQQELLPGFHTININVPEEELVKQILKLQQHGHKHGRNLPEMSRNAMLKKTLSDREAEVMVLIVKGYINKEIADKLNIGLTTVISHRKNIMTKLGLKSVSALTIYAVMHGYIDIDQV
jgi:DNA-binding NarL/FixJ family response regulator